MRTDFRQHDITDCGAACICSVAGYYGVEIPLSIARELSGTNELGTSFKGMMDAFAGIGFRALGYSSATRDVDALRNLPTPVILHTITKERELHFVVLYACGRKKVTIMDPSKGKRIRISYDALRKIWSGHLITIEKNDNTLPDPGTHTHTNSTSPTLFYRYVRIACFAKRDILSSLPGSFFSVISGIGTALCLQYIIDTVLPTGDVRSFVAIILKLLALITATALVTLLSAIFTLRAGVRIDATLILSYLRHLFSLSPGFFSSRATGELNSRIPDSMKIRRLITEAIPGALTGVLLLVGAVTMMFTFHKRLALVALGFIPLYLALTVATLRISRKLNRRVVESAAQFERQCVESISSVRTVKYFGCTSPSANAESAYSKLNWNLYRNGRAAILLGSGADLLGKLLSFAIIAAGGLFILKGSLSVGELISFYSLAAWFCAPLAEIARLGVELNEANLSLERLDDILVMTPEKEDGLEPDEVEAEDIIFNGISFSYPGCPTLLKDFNLTIPKGKILAVTGESGCGKSTLAALLMREMKPVGGHILLGMTDISLFSIGWWREYVSIVPQEPRLTGTSILDNISGGEKNPDLRRAAALMDSLGMRDFIVSLPLGMLTPAGEGGCMLSGGQRQRIAMARALWRRPKILILDEATASLDSESQDFILKAACQFRDEGGTVIMITHRKDNTEIADLIFHMEGESGRP